MDKRGSCGQGADLMQRGEIYLVSLDPTAGHEQQGTRPVLIVSPEAFNQVTQLPVVLPITSVGTRINGLYCAIFSASPNTDHGR